MSSLLSLARTLFLVMLLAAGSYFIHLDTRRLVLRPVERMVERVREMAEDPLLQANLRLGGLPPPPPPAAAAAGREAAGGGGEGAAPSSKEHGRGEGERHWGDGGRGGGEPLPASTAVVVVSSGAEAGDVAVAGRLQRCAHAARRAAAAALSALRRRCLDAWTAARRALRNASARVRAWRMAAALDSSLITDGGGRGGAGNGDEGEQGQYETQLLESSVYKICALLAVGFGDAGAEVIAENIREGGDLNPMVPGKKTVSTVSFYVGLVVCGGGGGSVKRAACVARETLWFCASLLSHSPDKLTLYSNTQPIPPTKGGRLWVLRHPPVHGYDRGAAGGGDGVCQLDSPHRARGGGGQVRGLRGHSWLAAPVL